LQLTDPYETEQKRPATESHSINVLPASLHSQTATRPTAGSLSAAHSKLRHWMEQSGKDARPGRFTLEEKPSLPIRKYG